MNILIYDIDGCIVDSSARYNATNCQQCLENNDYNEFRKEIMKYVSHTNGDKILYDGISLIHNLYLMYEIDRMVAVTARNEIG